MYTFSNGEKKGVVAPAPLSTNVYVKVLSGDWRQRMQRMSKTADKGRVHIRPNIPAHVRHRANLKPIISKGAFSLVWVNPHEPVPVPEEEDDIGEPAED